MFFHLLKLDLVPKANSFYQFDKVPNSLCLLCQIVYNPLTQCQTLLVKLLWSNYLIQYRMVSV